MALTLTELQADRDELVRVRASGELTVQFSDGRRITYRSIAELDAAISRLDDEIAKLQGTPAKSNLRRYVTKTGW